jgi:hypothetical protein
MAAAEVYDWGVVEFYDDFATRTRTDPLTRERSIVPITTMTGIWGRIAYTLEETRDIAGLGLG